MASTSPLCPADRLEHRSDLVVRPIPEIRLCLVYRPRPARIVTLNASSWLLFEACTGASVSEIEARVVQLADAHDSRPASSRAGEVRKGLQELVDLSIVQRRQPTPTTEGATS